MVSLSGDWIETTTTAWLLYEITGSPILLGLGGAIRALTIVLFGLVGGAIADRVARRRLLLFTQTGFALTSLFLGLLVVSGQLAFWHIYVFIAVNGTLGSFDAPSRRALFPNLVPRSEMQNAITLTASAFRLGRLIGPAIAGFIIVTQGPAVAYFVNSASYVAIIGALLLMRLVETPERPTAPVLRHAAEGLRYTLRHPLLRAVLILESIHSLFGVNTALLTIIAVEVLHAGPEGLGLLLSAQAVGALVATGALVTKGDIEHKGRTMLAAGGTYACGLALLAAAPRLEVAVALLVLLGLTDAFWTTMRNTVFQLQTAEAYRGRTLAVLLLAGRGATQASQFESGLAVSAGGPGFALILGAGVIGGALVAVNLRTQAIRRFRGNPDPLAAVASLTPEGPAD